MASYGNESPYANTTIVNGQYLGFLKIRPIPAYDDDILYTIESQYRHRPDLLAYDLYGSIKLWWVFAQRNMNTLKDPVYDMTVGTQIYLPQGSRLTESLGG
mgnify:FL=1|jgi:hypothetical protein|tara:strand:+ start:1706 stop:2008 length:303 start_codon:yes stop_codon:yes gene_type:complete